MNGGSWHCKGDRNQDHSPKKKCYLWILFIFPSSYVALWDSKTPQRAASERVSWCLETSPLLRLPPQDGSPSLTLLSLFLSFIFCLTFFRRQWAAFLGAWCPLPEFRSCFVEFFQHSNDLLMNLWGRKWSPCPIPPILGPPPPICLDNSMDRRPWQATVHRVSKSQTQLSD